MSRVLCVAAIGVVLESACEVSNLQVQVLQFGALHKLPCRHEGIPWNKLKFVDESHFVYKELTR